MTPTQKAAEFAKKAHGAQVRRYTGEPYWTHLERVAATVADRTDDEDLVVAAWLHDVLEDTAVTESTLVKEFGPRVTSLVLELTDVYTSEEYPDMNRAMRKRLEARRLAGISDEAKLIKIADLEDNTRDIEEHDPGFYKVYSQEKAEVLVNLTLGVQHEDH